jgi:oligosaccharide repeat unit polymerase
MKVDLKQKLLTRILWYTATSSAAFLFYLGSLIDFKTFLMIIVVILGFSSFIFAFFKKDSDALSPEVILPFTYMLYALGPLMGPLYAPLDISDKVTENYILLQVLGLLSMRMGLYSATRSICNISSAKFWENPRVMVNSFLPSTAIIMILLGALSTATQILSFGGLSNFLKTGYGGEYFLQLSKGFAIGGGFEWWLLGALLLISYGFMCNSRKAIFCGIALFLPAALIILLTGRRSQLLYPMLFCIVLLYYGHRKLSSHIIIPGLLAGIGAAQYYALARSLLPGGLVFALSNVWPAVLNNPLLIAPWMANEFRMPAASLLEVLQYGGPGLLLGSSYLSAIGAPIPFVARLFDQVGFDLNLWRMESLYPEILAKGGGFAYSPVTEAYVNFDILGIIVHMFVYGYLIGKIYARFISRPSLSSLLLLAGSIPVFMLDGLRVDSASFVWRWTRIYLMPLIIYCGLKILNPRSDRQNSPDEDIKIKKLDGKRA